VRNVGYRFVLESPERETERVNQLQT